MDRRTYQTVENTNIGHYKYNQRQEMGKITDLLKKIAEERNKHIRISVG